MKVYVASKTKHAADWQRYRLVGKSFNVDIISTWIDEAGVGETKSLEDLWLRCIGEASMCDILLCFAQEEEVLKGALVEVGAALSSGKLVYYVGPKSIGSWLHHPLVLQFPSLEEAFRKLRDLGKAEKAGGGSSVK